VDARGLMWYFHQMFSGPFLIGVAGNITAAILGFVVGLTVAHKVYDLRKIHAHIRSRLLAAEDKHREKP
jgi:hypothetical protein